MAPFWYVALAAAVGLDRLLSLAYSRRNQRRLGAEGAHRIHDPSYRGLVLVHVGYLFAAPLEVIALGRPFLPWLGFPALAVLLIATALRLWAVCTLAGHWNLSVVASQSLGPVTRGPYRWIRHPNYVAVFLEVASLPLVHTAWLTALIATLIQIPLLARRISVEETVLMNDPAYQREMGHKPRFFPQLAAMMLLAVLLCAQQPAGTIPGTVHGTTQAGATVRLLPLEADATTVRADADGKFRFEAVVPGAYILASELDHRGAVKAIRVEPRNSTNAGTISLPPTAPVSTDAVRVVTVCEALENHDGYRAAEVIVVGIFKSGVQETLREDCPHQLVTGEIAWTNAISLPPAPSAAGSSPVLERPDIRPQIEKKRAEVLASEPPGAQPRPERIVALYGRLASPSGLTIIDCRAHSCSDFIQIQAAPIQLLDLPPAHL